uniref:TBC1 domain family member 24 n=1 Tax=Sinocyclocheilus rhinocerous TaxID=307959 RepID=A0A673NFP0_9TELE
MTISEVDSWEINSSSGMKYGQYVDWEKIDREAAICYRKILSSDHYELKAMGRTGFWSMPHTLRAKAYQHIIHSIESTSTSADVDTYHGLVGTIFGEFQTSTHPFPKFMENGEIPRYCLNKGAATKERLGNTGINHHFPDVSFCPILSALVSLLLHFSEDEAQCFHSICSLVSYTDPNKRYIDQTFLISHASCMSFGDLNLFEFYSDWIMWIFPDLPFTYAIRVLDVYLMEGYKALPLAHVDDFRQDMKNFVQNVGRHSTIDTLLRRAFSSCPPVQLFDSLKEGMYAFCLIQNLRENTEIAVFLLHFDLLMPGLMATQMCGAFLSSDWAQKNCDEKGFKFFGTGECFVFTVSKSTFVAMVATRCTCRLTCQLAVLNSDTFESPPLCRGCFKIQSLEVWGIQHSLFVPPLLSQ